MSLLNKLTLRCLRDVRPATRSTLLVYPLRGGCGDVGRKGSNSTCWEKSSGSRAIATTSSHLASLESQPPTSETPISATVALSEPPKYSGLNKNSPNGAPPGNTGNGEGPTPDSPSTGGPFSGDSGFRKTSTRQVKFTYARPVPASPAYFSRQPQFDDAYVVVQDLARKYAVLPTVPKDQATPTAWRTKDQYRMSVGEQVKGRDFAECMKLCRRLNMIHPDVVPEEVRKGLSPFIRDVNYYLTQSKVHPVDDWGRSRATGRRKSSVATAYVVEGLGEVFVNGKTLADYFGRLHDRESAIWGMKCTDRLDKYNIWAKVSGGGTTGQAEALALAISKALCVHEPALKASLKRAGCITRDPRAVERKKHGHLKARKKPAWVKR